MGFHSFIILIQFSLRFDQYEIFECYILQTPHLDKNNYFKDKCGEAKFEMESWFSKKILRLEFILSHLFTSVEFHVLILLIKFCFFACFSQPKESMDLTLRQSKPSIPPAE